MAEAARLLGQADVSNLNKAAQKGRLKTKQLGPRARVTTRAWLDEYRQSLRAGGYKRGKAGSQESGDGTRGND